MIVITVHAEIRLSERGISRKHVELAVADPDFILPGKQGCKIAIKKIGGRFLKTVFRAQNGDIIVITSHWISSAGLRRKL
jgi:hypothetical protein